MGTVYLTPPGPPACCRVFRGGFILLFDCSSVPVSTECSKWRTESERGLGQILEALGGRETLGKLYFSGIEALRISHSIGGFTQPQSIIYMLSQCTAGFFHGQQLRDGIVQPTPKTYLQHGIISGHVMAELHKLFHKILQGADILIEGEQLVHRVNSC